MIRYKIAKITKTNILVYAVLFYPFPLGREAVTSPAVVLLIHPLYSDTISHYHATEIRLHSNEEITSKHFTRMVILCPPIYLRMRLNLIE